MFDICYTLDVEESGRIGSVELCITKDLLNWEPSRIEIQAARCTGRFVKCMSGGDLVVDWTQACAGMCRRMQGAVFGAISVRWGWRFMQAWGQSAQLGDGCLQTSDQARINRWLKFAQEAVRDIKLEKDDEL